MNDSANDHEILSKSARKREATRLQELGKELTSLKQAQLESLPLPDKLLQAILDYQRFTSHEARRRQLQYIGRLMRDAEADPLSAALADLRGESADARYRLHQAEQWRDKLIAEPAALDEYLTEFAGADRQALRRLLQRATQPGAGHQQKAAARTLFRLIRDQLAGATDGGPD